LIFNGLLIVFRLFDESFSLKIFCEKFFCKGQSVMQAGQFDECRNFL
jgi:hypothetical protein